MLLRKLSLTNVGLFQGRHDFDLLPRSTASHQRPIILIGGMNGAGKTTILDSLRLCLYGREAIGHKVSQIAYHDHLESLIHRPSRNELLPQEASIELAFEYAYLGITDVYQVARSWCKNGRGITEHLAVKKNAKLLDDFVAEQWQAFLKDLVPPGLSGLFFFDGEKIQNLADEVQGSVELADSIRSLLGLDLAARLANDLHTYTRKQASATPNKDVDSKLGQVQAEITSLDKQIARAEQSQAQVRASKDLLIAQIERTETTLRAEGGEFAQSRAELISEEKLLAARQEELQTALRSLCAETLPFALAPELSTALLRQLDAEQHLVQRQASLRELSHINRAASTELSRCLKEAGFDTKAAKKAVNAVQKWLNRHAAGQTASEHAMIHGLSTKDSRQLTATLTDALTIAPNRFTQLNTTLATLVNRRIAVQSALTKIPSDEHLAPILQKLQSLNQQLGACTEKLLAAEKNLRDLEYQRAEQQRLFDKLLSQKSSAGKNSAKITLANKVIYAMDDYMTRLTHRKIAQLNLAVLDKYAQLSRKSDAIKSISVDAETFRVTLLDSQDNAIEMKELSAGEKQILAVATLWALASTAGRLLPIVIDTPLGRLDSSHRTNLITNYFPFASHQVIILSTDTEVDKALYQELSPHISTVYHLIYDKSTKRTESQSGYFWQ